MITNYFKEKGLVDVYHLSIIEYVLIDGYLLLQLHSGINVYEFSLRSEIYDFYQKYAEDFIEVWEIEVLIHLLQNQLINIYIN
jgi:hypothetical protein